MIHPLLLAPSTYCHGAYADTHVNVSPSCSTSATVRVPGMLTANTSRAAVPSGAVGLGRSEIRLLNRAMAVRNGCSYPGIVQTSSSRRGVRSHATC